MITPHQVTELQPGDIVELTDPDWHGATLTGPLWQGPDGHLSLGTHCVRDTTGHPYKPTNRTLTFISHAPEPCYVNHHRHRPAIGDAVRAADNDDDPYWWLFSPTPDSNQQPWLYTDGRRNSRDELPHDLRLLIDGFTGLPPADASH
jgi:hypothetical protein